MTVLLSFDEKTDDARASTLPGSLLNLSVRFGT